jgi:hypothetical protein
MCAARNQPTETIEANIAAAESRGAAEVTIVSRPGRALPDGKSFVVDPVFLGAALVRQGVRMSPPELVNFSPLMARTSGRPSVKIALIDGPVALTHGELARENLREIAGANGGACARADSIARASSRRGAGLRLRRSARTARFSSARSLPKLSLARDKSPAPRPTSSRKRSSTASTPVRQSSISALASRNPR